LFEYFFSAESGGSWNRDLGADFDGVAATGGADDALGVGDARVVEDRVEAEEAGAVVAGLFERFGVVEQLTDGLPDDADVVKLEAMKKLKLKLNFRTWGDSLFWEIL
jgi:hypothetical protein